MATLLISSVIAVFTYMIAIHIKEEMPWIKINEWISAGAGFLFGFYGSLAVCLYIIYQIVKNHKYDE